MRRALSWMTLTLLAVLGAAGCAASDAGEAPFDPGAGEGSGPGGGGFAVCQTAADCPAGYTCTQSACVPPEVEQAASDARPPLGSKSYVYVLSPSANSLTRIDPRSLSLEAIPVGATPVDVAVVPGEDAAVTLSSVEASLSVVDSNTLPSHVLRVALGRRYGRLAVSPDGAYALAWPDPSAPPNSGAEGVVSLVDLRAVRRGEPAERTVLERAAGFRVTDVLFRVEGGVATRAYVFAKSTVTVLDLSAPRQQPLPVRISLPEAMAQDITSREVVATPDGQRILLRATTAPMLAAFDGMAFRTAPLPEVATDVDLLPDGSGAVAALRSAGQLAFIELPGDVEDPSGIQLIDVPGASVGQVVLPQQAGEARFALVYTTVLNDESVTRVDFPSGTVTRYPLEKRVERVALSADGHTALIIHKPEPESQATDPYERAVDLDRGYSVLDLPTGYQQLRRTGKMEPAQLAFSSSGGFVGVTLLSDTERRYAVDAVDLSTLVSRSVSLASPPAFAGGFAGDAEETRHRIFVSQLHPAGRISFVDLDDSQIRTVTGFTLNSRIE
jgi:DNA-binding beta-propeller fold protein YncE